MQRLFSFIHYTLSNAYDQKRYEAYRRAYEISPSFQFRGEKNELSGPGRIVLGDDSYMSSYCILHSGPGCVVRVGRNTAIGPYVKMFTESRIFEQDLDVPQLTTPLEMKRGNIVIGRGCWLAAGVGVVGGVTIGDNCVIGMNSVVTRDVPNNSFAAGCPAIIIKTKKL